MAPVAFGVLATIATVIVVAILVGAVGGAVTGRLRSDLVLGAAVSAVVHFVIVAAIKSSWSSGKIAVFRLLPLMITFVIASVATRFFLTRVRPVLAVLFGPDLGASPHAAGDHQRQLAGRIELERFIHV